MAETLRLVGRQGQQTDILLNLASRLAQGQQDGAIAQGRFNRAADGMIARHGMRLRDAEFQTPSVLRP